MKLGIYTANLSPRDRWERMQRMGFILYILQWTLIAASIGALGGLVSVFLPLLHDPLTIAAVLGDATGAGVAGALYAGYSWRSAKKQARTIGGTS